MSISGSFEFTYDPTNWAGLLASARPPILYIGDTEWEVVDGHLNDDGSYTITGIRQRIGGAS